MNEIGQMRPERCLDGRISSPGAWCAYNNEAGTWYLLDAGQQRLLAGLVTKGRGDTDQWVTSYTVATSLTGAPDSWTDVDGGRVFNGNTDRDTAVRGMFHTAVAGALVKVTPISWHRHTSMRVELLACKNTESRCGNLVPGETCQLMHTTVGGSYYFAPGYASDDRLGKVPESEAGKALDYPDDVGQYGPRGNPHSTGAALFVGRLVTEAQCGAACDSDPGCAAFTLLDDSRYGECYLQRHLDGATLNWKEHGVSWTTYYKATDAMTNMAVPPHTRSALF